MKPQAPLAEQLLGPEGGLLRILVDNLPDFVFIKDRESRIVINNLAHARALGAAHPGEVVGKTDFDYFSRELAGKYLADEQSVMRTGQTLEQDEPFIEKSTGQIRWLHTTKSVLRDADGNVIGLVGISRDITDHRQAEAALARTHGQLQAMLDTIPDRVYFKDAESRFVMYNQAVARRLGVSDLRQIAGKTDADFYPPEKAREFLLDEQRILQSGEPLINKIEIFTKPDGETTWAAVSKVPLRNPEGKVVGLVGISRDITEQMRAEEALRHSRDELEQRVAKRTAELSERNAYLTALQETLLDVISQLDLDRLLENILRRAGQLMGTSTGCLDLLEPGEDQLTPKIALGVLAEESLKHHVRRGEGLAGKVWETGQPILVEDYDTWKGRIEGHRQNLIQSIVEVPLISKTGFVGVLGLAHEKGSSRMFGPDTIGQLSEFARFATIAIENARLFSASRRELVERQRIEDALRETQALHHSLVEQMPTGLFRKDREGRYVFVNPWFCRLKGMQQVEFLGKTPRELEAYELAAQGRDNAEKIDLLANQGTSHHDLIMQSGNSIEVQEEYAGADGAIHHLHVVKSPVFSSDGTIVGSQGIMIDITDIKKAEAALAHERVLLRTIINNLPDAIYAKDTECRKILVNPADLKNLQCKTEAEAIGKNDFDLFPPEIAAKFYADDQAVIRGEPVHNREEFFFDHENKQHWLLTSKLPLRNLEGRIVGLVGIGRDITAIKEAERKLEMLHRELLTASRQAGMADVATGVLHNVGNVLNSVNVSAALIDDQLRNSRIEGVVRLASLLREQGANLGHYLTEDERGRRVPAYLDELANYLKQERSDLRKEVEVLKGNIGHIKEIVAMQQENARVFGLVETLPVPDLVEDALKLNDAGYARHGVTVKRDFAPLPMVAVDKHKALQILVNLLSNAKYACDAGPAAEKMVTVRIRAGGEGRVRIEVVDNGVGIAPENLTRIFSQGFTTRKGGHGFGLHTSALAARELGGSLTVHSGGLGHGAAFTLELPATPPPAASRQADEIKRFGAE